MRRVAAERHATGSVSIRPGTLPAVCGRRAQDEGRTGDTRLARSIMPFFINDLHPAARRKPQPSSRLSAAVGAPRDDGDPWRSVRSPHSYVKRSFLGESDDASVVVPISMRNLRADCLGPGWTRRIWLKRDTARVPIPYAAYSDRDRGLSDCCRPRPIGSPVPAVWHGYVRRRSVRPHDRGALARPYSTREATAGACGARSPPCQQGITIRSISILNGRVKTGHLWAPQNRPFPARDWS